MVSRLLCLLALTGICLASPLGDLEKELKKEGVDLVKLHEELKHESEELEEEFSSKDTQNQLAKLRAAYHTCSNDTIQEKTELEVNGDLTKDLFEGDIVLTKEQWARALDRDPNVTLQRRQALTDAIKMWTPMGAPIIPYSYVDGFPEDKKPVIIASLKFWEGRTCVKFREATETDKNVVVFNHISPGCSSSVGMVGGKQTVNLGSGCFSVTVVAHEVSHAFGTLHVQSRSDRDNYIIVDTANIQQGKEHNFMKDPPYYGKIDNYGIPYEFGSMQHYHEKAFAIDTTKPTIYAKPAFTQYQGSMEAPRASFYDTLLINKLYKCTDKCQNKITCQNNGVQDGADCNKCFCPKGWAGTNCDMRPDSAIMIKLISNQNITVTVEAGTDEMKEILYIIEAPVGKKIQAVVTSIYRFMYSMCRTVGVEIVPSKDTRVNGFRFCGKPDATPIVSDSNQMLIWLYNEKANPLSADIQLTLV
ncbi:hypothetical protein PRIPAC_78959 [Pristionchus pacificus]|uniref:Zinc metalloproteinase n=1 Tax=Pristionchus pacificus TaxID=54126 RepID=A0A8R1Z6N9_PRIPA|nr:hypothetical protein PRIPAC_78959 [Pristionchus pacificus]